MSKSHNNPPFTLDKFEAAMLINKHIEIEDLTIQEQQEVENEIRKRRSSNQS